ncbi:MAG TPA: TlpA disulfide reductase family protein [Pirellulales bacterium]|nr:TlpA disulfide reductase family protein [Pirellulales bacterium]
MRPCKSTFMLCLLGAGFLFAGVLHASAAEEPGNQVKRHLEELEQVYQKFENDSREDLKTHKERTDSFLARLTDAEFLACIRDDQRRQPQNMMAAEFLALAEREPDPRVAVPALCHALGNSSDPESPAWQVQERALELALRRHIEDRELDQALVKVHWVVPAAKAEALLRAALDKSPHREVRAAACYYLACYLYERSKLADRIRSTETEDDATWRRFWLLVTIPYMKSMTSEPPERYVGEAQQLLKRLTAEFADVSYPEYQLAAGSRIRLTSAPSPDKTYAKAAEGMLFAIEHLQVGCQAPEIEGKDAGGVVFRLSDYRGKVVCLTFSANWCGACVAAYPAERESVEKWRNEPFVLLSVSGDEKVDTLREAVRRGEITWHCWWDGGRDGAICTRWHVDAWPTIYLLDAKGVIRYKEHGGDLTPIIEGLIREAKR